MHWCSAPPPTDVHDSTSFLWPMYWTHHARYHLSTQAQHVYIYLSHNLWVMLLKWLDVVVWAALVANSYIVELNWPITVLLCLCQNYVPLNSIFLFYIFSTLLITLTTLAKITHSLKRLSKIFVIIKTSIVEKILSLVTLLLSLPIYVGTPKTFNHFFVIKLRLYDIFRMKTKSSIL